MMRVRNAWLLWVALAIAAVLLLLLDPWGGMSSPPEGDAGHGAGSTDHAGASEDGPELSTRTKSAARSEGVPDESTAPLPEDIWTIEVAEVVGPDGKSLRGASIYIDQARHVNRTWTWNGSPVRLHMRPWVNAGGRRQENEREGYVVCDDTPVYLSVRYEGRATWFAPALRYVAGEKTTLRAVLGARRTLRAIVLTPDGRRPARGSDVTLRPAHVPAAMFSLEADGDDVFGRDEPIPAGPLVVTARANSGFDEFKDGMPVSVEVGPDETEVTLTLRRAHRFQFKVTVVEPAGVDTFVDRRVQFLPPEKLAQAGVLARRLFCPVPCAQATDMDTRVLVPEGERQRWCAALPGYATVDLDLDASGEEREHVVEARLVPSVGSGVLVLDIEGPGPALHGHILLEVVPPDAERAFDAWARWSVNGTKGTGAALRLPSGRSHWVFVSANIRRPRSSQNLVVPPVNVSLADGERREHSVPMRRAAALMVARKREGGLMPNLHVRLTQEAAALTLKRWVHTRHVRTRARIYGMFCELPVGTWTVELVRAGTLLPWSERVHLIPGKTATVRIPDEVVLPPKER